MGNNHNPNNSSTQRQCVKCKCVKPLSSDYYGKDKNRPYGFMYKCKECEKLRPDNRDARIRWLAMSPTAKASKLASSKKYSKTPKGKSIGTWQSYKKYDEKKGFQNDITQEDILDAVENKQCHYCGFAATGFDRIDNSKGHTKENCLPCCKECNIARMDNFTSDEMLDIGETIRLIKATREKKVHGICML